MRGWPFVGRDQELARVSAKLHEPGKGVLLLGAAGVGKTRVAEAALAGARDAGALTVWVAATEATAAIPLGVVAHLAPNPTGLNEASAAHEPERMFHRVANRLLAQANGRLLVLGVDDAHLLDQASAALVHHLVASGTAAAVLTARTGISMPEPLTALRKDGYLDRCEVGALGKDAVGQLLHRFLGGTVAAATVRHLTWASGGNALYLRELVAGGLETGTLAERHGVWQWIGEAPTARLQELMADRLDGLPVATRNALEILALAEPLELALFEAVQPDSALEDLERRDLVAVEPADDEVRLRLAHPLYTEIIRASVPALAARRIHDRLADALERDSAKNPRDALRLATWRVASGGKVEPAVLVAGGYQAYAAGDAQLAERLAQRADLAGDPDARYLLALALAGQGRVDDAHHEFGKMHEAATPTGRARLALTAAQNEFWFANRYDQAQEHLREATELVKQSNDRALAHSLAAAEAGFLLMMDTTTHTLNKTALVLDATDTHELPLLRACIVASMAAAMAGRTTEALAAAKRGAPLAPRHPALQPGGTDLLLTNRSLAHRLAGDLELALTQADRGRDACTDSEVPEFTYPLWLMAVGQACTARGAIDDAVRWLREATAHWKELGNTMFLGWCLANLAQAHGMAGDLQHARSATQEAEALHHPALRAFDCDLHLARGWAAAAAGEHSRGAASCLAAAEAARQLHQHAFEVIALGDATRLGAAQLAKSRLAELSNHVEGPLAPILADYATALAAEDPAHIEAAAQRFQDINANLHAAEAWAECARANRRQGKAAPARNAIAHSRALTDTQCKGAYTPTLSGLNDEPTLTRREREIAELAGRGMTNPIIAERLHISIRTVENHLHKVYFKLGVAGRTELTNLLKRMNQ